MNLGKFSWIFLALVIQVVTAFYSNGYNHPDEHFQVLEPAYGIVFDDWVASWEWERGIRSYILPVVFSWGIRVFKAIGFDDPSMWSFFFRLILGIQFLSVFFIFDRWGKKIQNPSASLWMFYFLIGNWVFHYFTVRTLTGSIVMPWVVLGSYLSVFLENKNPKKAFFLGLLCGGLFLIRFQMALFGVGFFILMLIKKQYRNLLPFCLGVSLCLVLLGAVDVMTWGTPFHSMIEYFKFNILEKGASQFGEDPWHRYITALSRFFTAPIAVLSIIFVFYAGFKKRKESLSIIIGMLPFLIIHHLIAHKEDRFLLPVLPLWIWLACIGWTGWKKTLSEKKERVAVVFGIGLCGISFLYGAFHHQWKWQGDFSDLYRWLGTDDRVTGVAQTGKTLTYGGGNYYFHKRAPLVYLEKEDFDFKSVIDQKINTFIIYDDSWVISKFKEKGISCNLLDPKKSRQVYLCDY
tara:strand:+ start:871 stop:2256 length:1386 start_codon:yes stop_codon:yes gene_type:complete